jgi:hypothetical protein
MDEMRKVVNLPSLYFGKDIKKVLSQLYGDEDIVEMSIGRDRVTGVFFQFYTILVLNELGRGLEDLVKCKVLQLAFFPESCNPKGGVLTEEMLRNVLDNMGLAILESLISAS